MTRTPYSGFALAIGQGLTAWSFIALLEDFSHVTLGWNRQFIILVHVRMLAYIAVLVYWIVVSGALRSRGLAR